MTRPWQKSARDVVLEAVEEVEGPNGAATDPSGILQLDSGQVAVLVVAIEDRLGESLLKGKEREVLQARTVRDLVDLVSAIVAAAPRETS